MKSLSISAVIILMLAAIAAFAQEPQDLFCNAGLLPNGYIGCSADQFLKLQPADSRHLNRAAVLCGGR
jgi:hypothetical protein